MHVKHKYVGNVCEKWVGMKRECVWRLSVVEAEYSWGWVSVKCEYEWNSCKKRVCLKSECVRWMNARKECVRMKSVWKVSGYEEGKHLNVGFGWGSVIEKVNANEIRLKNVYIWRANPCDGWMSVRPDYVWITCENWVNIMIQCVWKLSVVYWTSRKVEYEWSSYEKWVCLKSKCVRWIYECEAWVHTKCMWKEHTYVERMRLKPECTWAKQVRTMSINETRIKSEYIWRRITYDGRTRMTDKYVWNACEIVYEEGMRLKAGFR